MLSVSFENVGLQLLIFVGFVVFMIAFSALFLRLLYLLREFIHKKYFSSSTGSINDLQGQKALLDLAYFKNLSPAGKAKFMARLKKVTARLQFSTEGGVVADDEKKALLAAAAVQITFGLNEFDLDSIEHIKVFADDIYNPKTKVRYKGLTFLNGNMFISWKHFLEGNRDPADGINLGLHETAHGLYIMIKQYRGYDDFDEILNEWYKYAYNEIDHTNDGKNIFFRKYADANIQEFFAICIENFFERPAEFQRKLPAIYGQLCAFLNQNPLESNDYAFIQENVPAAGPPSERLYLHKNRTHPSMGLLIWLSGVCVVGMIFMKGFFLETLFNLLLFSIPCMFISYKLFRKFYLHTRRLSKKWYFVFCFAGINPIVFTLVLVLNLGVSSGIAGKKTFSVSSIQKYFLGVNQNDLAFLGVNEDTIYMLEDNYTVPIDLRVSRMDGERVKAIEYTYHYGITGLKICDKVELKYE